MCVCVAYNSIVKVEALHVKNQFVPVLNNENYSHDVIFSDNSFKMSIMLGIEIITRLIVQKPKFKKFTVQQKLQNYIVIFFFKINF